MVGWQGSKCQAWQQKELNLHLSATSTKQGKRTERVVKSFPLKAPPSAGLHHLTLRKQHLQLTSKCSNAQGYRKYLIQTTTLRPTGRAHSHHISLLTLPGSLLSTLSIFLFYGASPLSLEPVSWDSHTCFSISPRTLKVDLVYSKSALFL